LLLYIILMEREPYTIWRSVPEFLADRILAKGDLGFGRARATGCQSGPADCLLAFRNQRRRSPSIAYAGSGRQSCGNREIWGGSVNDATEHAPATIVRWYGRGFRVLWRWKARRRLGRPGIAQNTRDLIREISRANPLWGAPRVHGELIKLGIDVAQSTVATCMSRIRRPPSGSARTCRSARTRRSAGRSSGLVASLPSRCSAAFITATHESDFR
jgi:hypothetical protein